MNMATLCQVSPYNMYYAFFSVITVLYKSTIAFILKEDTGIDLLDNL